jgi:sigma-B regulation protein RsbU (phosphoserine phosphatase)
MWPAREVGGDLYDFFPLPDDRLFVLAGDAAGGFRRHVHGRAKRLPKFRVARARISEPVMTLNTEISRDNPADLFVTLIARHRSVHGTTRILQRWPRTAAAGTAR